MTDHVTTTVAIVIDIHAELVKPVSDCLHDRYWPLHGGDEVPHEAGRREESMVW